MKTLAPWRVLGSRKESRPEFEKLFNERRNRVLQQKKQSKTPATTQTHSWPTGYCVRQISMFIAGDRIRTDDVQLGKLAFYH